MKRLMISAMLLCAFAMANAQIASEYKVGTPVEVKAPFVADTADMYGKKFDIASLLGSVKPSPKIDGSVVAADTLSLTKPADGYAVQMVEARFRPDRYLSGSVKVESPARFEVYVDGESKTKKTTAEDSVTSASSKKAAMELQPQMEHAVLVKLLLDSEAAADPTLAISFEPDQVADSAAVAWYAQGKRRFQIDDIALGCRVSDVSISPDGKYLITKYADRYTSTKSRTWATLTDLKTGKVIRDRIDERLRWMPKGSRMYYAEKVSNGYDVHIVEAPDMREVRVIANVPVNDFEWWPNEQYLLYYQHEKGVEMKGPVRRYLDPDDRIEGNRERMVPCIYDVNTGASRALSFGNRQVSVCDVAPNGKKVLMTFSKLDATRWPFYFCDLIELDIDTMQPDTLMANQPVIEAAVYSPDGKQAFIVGDPYAFGGIGLNAGGHPIANTSDAQGYLLNIADKTAKAMTREFNPSISGQPVWNRASGRIYFRAEDGFYYHLYALDPATGKIEMIPTEVAYAQRFSIGNDEKEWLAYCGQGATASGQAYLYDLKKGKTTMIADPWSEVASQIDWGKMEPYNFTKSDGTVIEGWLTYPPEFDPSQKYPMIVYYYGGTAPTFLNCYSQYNPQLLASRGYVVYMLNPSGTTGYGQEFSARHVNAWGDYTADDIIEGVKRVLADHDFVNPDKVGAIGASYGGFMTQYLLTLTDIFAAAVSHAGISNVTSYWGEGNWGYSYNALAAAESYPWNNPELFTRHGSLFNADKIDTPLLLTHGAADNNVPVGESIQLFNALKILGKDVELVTFDGEDHYISGYDHRKAWHEYVMAWFAKWLKDEPAWWEQVSE